MPVRRLWNAPLRAFALGTACGIFGMLAAPRVAMPDRLWPARRLEAPAADRVPDALGASLARSLAKAGQQALRHAPGRAGCEASIAAADAAALRAAEDARGKQRNTQTLSMVLSAEDLYLAAARLCLRQAQPVCRSAPRRTEGCEQVLAVGEAELASTRSLRASRGN